MPYMMIIQSAQYCDKLKPLRAACAGLWRQISHVAVVTAWMVTSCNWDRAVVWVCTIQCKGTQWLPLCWGLGREVSLWDEHVYPALLTWFISTSEQPEHELFTLHEEKGKRQGRGVVRYGRKMSIKMQRNGRRREWVIEIGVHLTKTWKRGKRIQNWSNNGQRKMSG